MEMCISDKFFLFVVPLAGTIRVLLFSCLLPRSIQQKCVLSWASLCTQNPLALMN